MSWLLVALIPGLMMVAALGLERVESALRRDAISAADVNEFLDEAEAGEIDALARGGMNNALHNLRQRLDGRDSATGSPAIHAQALDVPIHQYFQHRANPEFRQTPRANPV